MCILCSAKHIIEKKLTSSIINISQYHGLRGVYNRVYVCQPGGQAFSIGDGRYYYIVVLSILSKLFAVPHHKTLLSLIIYIYSLDSAWSEPFQDVVSAKVPFSNLHRLGNSLLPQAAMHCVHACNDWSKHAPQNVREILTFLGCYQTEQYIMHVLFCHAWHDLYACGLCSACMVLCCRTINKKVYEHDMHIARAEGQEVLLIAKVYIAEQATCMPGLDCACIHVHGMHERRLKDWQMTHGTMCHHACTCTKRNHPYTIIYTVAM